MSQHNEIEDSPSEIFVAELKRWREVRGFSQSALAREVGYGPSYVSKVESGQQRPSLTFAERRPRLWRRLCFSRGRSLRVCRPARAADT